MSRVDLINARIWSGRGVAAEPATLHVDHGRVHCVGPAHGQPRQGAMTIDAGGRVVTPGLVDAHVHLLLGGQTLQHVDLSGVRSRAAFEAVIEAAHQDMDPSHWLVASGWSEYQWPGQARPDHTWLAAASSRPVVCWRCDWHAAVVNEAVLQQMNLPDDATVEAAGGHVGRDADGAYSGYLAEAAAWRWLQPVIPPPDLAQQHAAATQAMAHLLSLGITAVRTMEYRADIEQTLLPMAQECPMRLSLVQLDRTLPLELDWHDQLPSHDRFRLTGCKSFFDGTLGSRTARLRQPYQDQADSRGSWLEHALDDQDGQWCRQVVDRGLSPVIHAIGDEAVGRAAALLSEVPDTLRATLEHAEVVSPEDFSRVEGLRLSVQPTHRAVDARMAVARLGQARSPWVLPMSTLQRVGARLSFGTDWPVVSADPKRTLQAAITGHDAEGEPFHEVERLSVEAAWRAATVDAAEAAGLPVAMQPGGPADFVIWNGDPLANLDEASVHSTWVDGQCVFGEHLCGLRS